MPARVTTIAFEGAEVRRVEAEVVLTKGHVAFQVVGLGDKAVAESKERVRGAFAGIGLGIPNQRIVANLSPADLFFKDMSRCVSARIPEFSPQALDALRQPLETNEVVVARANHHVKYPVRVQLIAAQDPCKCGYGGVGKGACGKAPRCLRDYQGRVSGPLLDRIDLQIDVPPVTAADLALPPPAEGSAEVAVRVAAARAIQAERAKRLNLPAGNALNATAYGSGLEAIAALDPAAKALLTQAAEQSGLTARGWTRTLRLARTIADLEQSANVLRRHVAEALIYRRTGMQETPRPGAMQDYAGSRLS